jgi:hypothetical protein
MKEKRDDLAWSLSRKCVFLAATALVCGTVFCIYKELRAESRETRAELLERLKAEVRNEPEIVSAIADQARLQTLISQDSQIFSNQAVKIQALTAYIYQALTCITNLQLQLQNRNDLVTYLDNLVKQDKLIIDLYKEQYKQQQINAINAQYQQQVDAINARYDAIDAQYQRAIEANNAQYDEFTRQQQANQLNDNLDSINRSLQQLDWRLWDQFSRPGR